MLFGGVTRVFAASTKSTLATGGQHACALIGREVKCWGENVSGQLANGNTVSSNVPKAANGIHAVVSIAAGGPGVTCVLTPQVAEAKILKTGNDMWCAGSNLYGLAAGNGSYNGIVNNLTRVPIWDYIFKRDDKGEYVLDHGKKIITEKIGAEEIAIGGAHILVRLSSGVVKSWGDGWGSPKAYGALGRETHYSKKDAYMPLPVPAFQGAVSIATGTKFSCAVLANGNVMCTGDNSYGALGNGSKVAKSELPVEVQGITNALQVTAGGQFACALLRGGAVECWGANSVGELGDGTFTKRLAPVAVQGLNNTVQTIDAGAEHVCALLTDNTLQCWGKNTNGQLGDGIDLTKTTRKNSSVPVTPTNLGAVSELSLAGNYSCAKRSSGEIRCWGDDTMGQLGDGKGLVSDTTKNYKSYLPVMSTTPVNVRL